MVTLEMSIRGWCGMVGGGCGESGLRERQSGITWSFPGMYLGTKLNMVDFSLQFISLGLGMVMNSCLPSKPISGLWSRHRVNVFMPRRKSLHFSMAQTAADASPSMGAMFPSAGVQNLLLQ